MTQLADEKQFYLDAFHGRTIAFALPASLPADTDLEPLLAATAELIAEDCRILIIDGESTAVAEQCRTRLLGAAQTVATRTHLDPTLDELADLWERLRATPAVVVSAGPREVDAQTRWSIELAARLRIQKLVVLDPAGGIGTGQMSFLDANVLDTLLGPGSAEWAGLGERRGTLTAIRRGLQLGIPSINLCAPQGVAGELFSYVGTGTLFTPDDYCRVGRVGIDDFDEVERLLARGIREGFLKSRSTREVGKILLTATGAWLGHGGLAGVGALLSEPYTAARVGEVIALYTISRFKGEGVGERIIAAIERQARADDLVALFACTTEDRAAAFFERQGFRRVTRNDVPAAKWAEYGDDGRRERLMIIRKDLVD